MQNKPIESSVNSHMCLRKRDLYQQGRKEESGAKLHSHLPRVHPNPDPTNKNNAAQLVTFGHRFINFSTIYNFWCGIFRTHPLFSFLSASLLVPPHITPFKTKPNHRHPAHQLTKARHLFTLYINFIIQYQF